MVTLYPGGYDSLTNPTASDDLDSAGVFHDQQHANINDAMEAVQAELGLNPRGVSASVRARLDAVDLTIGNKVNTTLLGAASGVATLDGSSKLVQFVDAAKVNSGTFATARIPQLASSKIDTASGAFNLALIPSLPASQIGSGLLAVARIPPLDAGQITTGTFAAARIPNSVAANANARVEADVAARDAISMGSRIDGMLVWTTAEKRMWKWRAAGSAWDNLGIDTTLEFSDANDILGVTSTTFTPGSPLCGGTFVAPQSGIMEFEVIGHLEGNAAGAIAYLTFEIRTGAVLGAGAVIHPAITEEAYAVGGPGVTRGRGSSGYTKVTGLTPGSTYNIYTMHQTLASNIDVFFRKIVARPGW